MSIAGLRPDVDPSLSAQMTVSVDGRQLASVQVT